MSEIIEQLKNLRQEHQLTALEISIGCQTTERSVWRWINGGNSPSPQAIASIEKFITETRTKFEKEEREKFERCEAMILDEIFNSENLGLFHARPKPGERYSEGTYPVGTSQRDVSLKSLSKACAMRLTDPIILRILDHLAQRGQIKINLIFVPIRRNFEHLNFKIETGEARRDVPAQDRDFKVIRPYKDKPLTQEEIKINPGILNPKEEVEAIYKRHEDSLRARYGASGIEAEIREHKEKVYDDATARISQLEASESLGKITNKGAKKMEGDHVPVSEYTEIKTLKKVREFYEEVVENNTDRPLVVYNCNHEKVEIPPREKRVVLRARLIKKMPVEEGKTIK